MSGIRREGRGRPSRGAESRCTAGRSLCWVDRSQMRSAVVGLEPEGGVGRAAQGAEEQDGVGAPDNFGRLWTPHRMAYIKGENKPSGGGAGDDCPFCEIPKMSDEDGLVTARGAV